MHHLLPSPKSTCYNVRTLGHGLSVNPVKSELHKNTFINRLIFHDCYCFCFTSFVLFHLVRLFLLLCVVIFVILLMFYVLVRHALNPIHA